MSEGAIDVEMTTGPQGVDMRRCAESPFDAKVALELLTALRDARVPEPLDAMTEMQLMQEEPVPAVLAAILRQESSWRGESRRDRLVVHLERYIDSEVGQLLSSVWDAMRELRPLDEELVREAAKLPPTAYEAFWFARPPKKVAWDAAGNLHPRAVQFWRSEFLAAEEDGIARPVFTTGSQTQRTAEARFDESERNTAFQSRAVRDGRMVFRDPETADLVEPFDSCQAGMAWQYSFGDTHLSVMLAGGGGQKAVFVYTSASHELLDLKAGLASSYDNSQTCVTLARLMRRAVVKSDGWAAATQSRRDVSGTRRRVALVAIHAENPMHHLWNLFPACEKLVHAGIASRVDELWTTPTDFYGSLPDLFPEFGAAEHHDTTRVAVADPHPFSPAHIVVRIGGYFMRRSLLDRVVAAMRVAPRRSGAVDPDPHDYGPVVWFGLRVGSRSWHNQDIEIPQVIDLVHERYPDARIVLDGYTHAVGADRASERWEGAIAQLSALTSQITSRVAHPERLVDLSGQSLREATLWADATDVYVTPSGSSQHKVGWFTDGHGIMYGPESLAERTRRSALPGTYQAEGRGDCILVTGRVVDPGERRTVTDTRQNLENLAIDHVSIAERVMEMIADRMSSRTQEVARR